MSLILASASSISSPLVNIGFFFLLLHCKFQFAMKPVRPKSCPRTKHRCNYSQRNWVNANHIYAVLVCKRKYDRIFKRSLTFQHNRLSSVTKLPNKTMISTTCSNKRLFGKEECVRSYLPLSIKRLEYKYPRIS